MKALKDEIKNNNLAKCYLFYGEETYLLKMYENKIRKLFSNEFDAGMNINVFNGAEDINSIIDAAETLPFFADKRLVLVKDSGLFAKGRKNDSETMTKFIKDVHESVCIVFVEKKVEKTNVFYKAMSKAGRCIEFKPLSESELVSWVELEFKESGHLCDKKTILYFLRTVGGGMENIKSEMDKIFSYIPKDKKADIADIDSVCTKSLETKIFDLIDAIGTRETEKALNMYKNLILFREEPINILAMISRQFKIMLQCKALLEAGEPQFSIAERIGENPFAVKKCISQGKNFTSLTLKKAFEECVLMNSSIKSGAIGDRLAVETLIIKYSN